MAFKNVRITKRLLHHWSYDNMALEANYLCQKVAENVIKVFEITK